MVSGEVQGVNLRYDTSLKAKTLGLVGYVKNQPNGSVEIVVIGGIEELKKLLKWLKSSPGYAKVFHAEHEELSHNQAFEKFKILY